MVSLIWTETANSDLIEIKEYISFDSIRQAELVIEGLFTKAQILLKYPEVGRIISELSGYDYRQLIFKKVSHNLSFRWSTCIYHFGSPQLSIIN